MDPLWKLKSKKTHDDHDIGDDEDAEDRFIDVEEDDKDAKVWKLWKDKSEGKERKEGLTDLPWKLKDKKDGKKGAALWCVLFALTACRQDIHDLSTCSALIIAGRMLSSCHRFVLQMRTRFRCAHALNVHDSNSWLVSQAVSQSASMARVTIMSLAATTSAPKMESPSATLSPTRACAHAATLAGRAAIGSLKTHASRLLATPASRAPASQSHQAHQRPAVIPAGPAAPGSLRTHASRLAVTFVRTASASPRVR